MVYLSMASHPHLGSSSTKGRVEVSLGARHTIRTRQIASTMSIRIRIFLLEEFPTLTILGVLSRFLEKVKRICVSDLNVLKRSVIDFLGYTN